jgi:hypothetical protein
VAQDLSWVSDLHTPAPLSILKQVQGWVQGVSLKSFKQQATAQNVFFGAVTVSNNCFWLNFKGTSLANENSIFRVKQLGYMYLNRCYEVGDVHAIITLLNYLTFVYLLGFFCRYNYNSNKVSCLLSLLLGFVLDPLMHSTHSSSRSYHLNFTLTTLRTLSNIVMKTFLQQHYCLHKYKQDHFKSLNRLKA